MKITKILNEDTAIVEAKKKKKPYSSMTITTGDPVYNMQEFNKRSGGSYLNGTIDPGFAEEANASSSEAAGESVGGEGGMAEELKVINEAKRYVRRYYVRPLNKFASNKAEIVKLLIEADAAGKNCSVYTLNNLGDVKDVTKLTNDDIIYYYDDGILYDKNHVKILDYDLYVKHEEDRPKITVETTPETKFNDVYHDRITATTGLDEQMHEKQKELEEEFSLTFDSFNAYGEKLTDGKTDICCICGEPIDGYGNNAEPYKTGRCCDACNLKFVIPARLDALKSSAEQRDETTE